LRPHLAVLAVAGAATFLLLYNVGSSLCARDVPGRAAGRYYADVSMAASFAATGDFPVAAYHVRRASVPRSDEGFEQFRRALVDGTEAAGLRCWSAVGAILPSALPDVQLVVRRADDPGRALLLGHAFRAIGVAPFLLFWLAPVLGGAVLLWAAWELDAAGHGAAAAFFLVLVATSGYAVDTLSLDYSPAGFYLAALLLVLPVTAYAARPPSQRSVGGVWRRAVLAGVLFGVCVIGRRSAAVAAPFLLAALVFALRGLLAARPPVELRIEGVRPEAIRLLRVPLVWLAAVGAAVALFAPGLAGRSYADRLVARTSVKYGLAAPPQAHDLWVSLWEGLGDFDRTKGHAWLDEHAQRLVGSRLLSTPESERILRAAVLRDIREDPGWYARILVQRFWATLVQRRLWSPPRPEDLPADPVQAASAARIDAYYSLAATVDRFRLGPWLFDVPILLLLACLLGWMLLALRSRWSRSPDGLRTAGLVIGAYAAASLVLPVAITTAGALEPQAFALSYFLAAAFLAEAALRRVRSMIRGRRGADAPALSVT
jgi:hypothetical protein